jgi:hypothetical protein
MNELEILQKENKRLENEVEHYKFLASEHIIKDSLTIKFKKTIMKDSLKKLINKIPNNVKKTFKVAVFGIASTLLSFGVTYILTSEINVVELEGVIKTYLVNVLLAYAAFFREQEAKVK